MITALAGIVVAALVVMLLQQRHRDVPPRPLSAVERVYAILAPAPLLLTLGAPSLIVAVLGVGSAAREWSTRLTNSGIVFSLVLTVVGIYFLSRRRHAGGPSPWLVAAVFIAAVPTGLVALLILGHC